MMGMENKAEMVSIEGELSAEDKIMHEIRDLLQAIEKMVPTIQSKEMYGIPKAVPHAEQAMSTHRPNLEILIQMMDTDRGREEIRSRLRKMNNMLVLLEFAEKLPEADQIVIEDLRNRAREVIYDFFGYEIGNAFLGISEIS